MGVLMDPQNGDILAMASLPDFDLNNQYDTTGKSEKQSNNRSI